ncbi:MAG: hypothetical protein K2Y23_10070 [Cyanobacteria bacterium]|nr:hypothetical protein [Cyanobacteriota bacterium]
MRQSFRPEPSLIEQLISREARSEAAALHEVNAAAIRAKTKMIDGLAECIATYVSAHRGDLTVRAHSFILHTFTGLYRGLTAVIEQTHVGLLDNYSRSALRIENIPGLTDEMRRDHSRRAYDRALRAMDASEQRFEELLDQVSAEVRRVIEEIGS